MIGRTKLLNFTATSWPSYGGIALSLAASLIVVASVTTFRAGRETA